MILKDPFRYGYAKVGNEASMDPFKVNADDVNADFEKFLKGCSLA